MTDLEHADISRRLALAIGWPEHKLYSEGDGSFCSINISDMPPIRVWRDFDYRDPVIAWGVAERFNAFPRASAASGGDLWFARVRGPIQLPMLEFSKADTAALAVAMAAIKAKESE